MGASAPDAAAPAHIFYCQSAVSPIYLLYISPISPQYLPYPARIFYCQSAVRPHPHPNPNPSLNPSPYRNPNPTLTLTLS